MRFPFNALLKALYTRLNSGLVLTPNPTVHTFNVPGGILAPYLVISQLNAVPIGSKTSSDHEVQATVSCYAAEGNLQWVNSAMGEVVRVISASALTLDDDWQDVGPGLGKVVVAEVVPYFEETEGVVLVQGVIRYSWRIQDKSPQ